MLHEELFEVLIPLTDSPGLVCHYKSTFFKNHFTNFGPPAIETFQHLLKFPTGIQRRNENSKPKPDEASGFDYVCSSRE